MLFSIVAAQIYISTNSAREFPFLHTLFSIYCLQIFFFDVGHSDQGEVITHCKYTSFDLRCLSLLYRVKNIIKRK